LVVPLPWLIYSIPINSYIEISYYLEPMSPK
jgi:hypothetical protein